MTPRAAAPAALLALSALLAAGCGSSASQEPATAPSTAGAPTTGAASAPATSAATTDGVQADGPTVLRGSVGTDEDPEAFVITLTTDDGSEVKTLPAGDYEIQVDDPALIHNFHLMGPGGVDEMTSVSGTGMQTFDVTLEAGEYTYQCDPHKGSMSGTFTVQ